MSAKNSKQIKQLELESEEEPIKEMSNKSSDSISIAN